MRLFFTFFFGVCLAAVSTAQPGAFWASVSEAQLDASEGTSRTYLPQEYFGAALDIPTLRGHLAAAPMEFTPEANKNTVIIDIPTPEGNLLSFRVVESPVMKPGLAAKYPMIKTYSGVGVDDPSISTRFGITEFGFHAVVRTPKFRYYIDPYKEGQTTYYMVYDPKTYDFEAMGLPGTTCGFDAEDLANQHYEPHHHGADHSPEKTTEVAVDLRVYDLALACTGEFGQIFGGTTSSVMSAFTTAVNRVNEIMIIDLSIKMELIDNTDLLIFLNSATDPYDVGNNGGALLNSNQSVTTSIIPPVNFDIGHVVTGGCTDVGGIASLGSVCNAQNKARGVTCFSNSDVVYVAENIMAHEMGHQYSATHSWSNCPSSQGNVSSGTAFEPGSGSTIMSYSGLCGDQNIQFDADGYYHVSNLQQMIGFTRQGPGNGCPTIVQTGNNEPSVELLHEDGFFIPTSTPFRLTAAGSDPDGDEITYCWEQYDLGPESTIGNPIGDAPLFRTFPPTDDPTRIFPRYNKILGNILDDVEVLPTYSRNMTFRCTVRDNFEEGGAAVWEELKFKVDGNTGPFLVEYPNLVTDGLKAGDFIEVKWDVANTDNAQVNCQSVNILLSIDGGFTFEYPLLFSAPNTGSAFVYVPDVQTNTARIMIEAADNIFFDISNQAFPIAPATEPTYTLNVVSPLYQQVCVPAGEVTLEFESSSILQYDSTITLEVVDGLPAGATATFTTNPVTPGESTTLIVDFDALTENQLVELSIRAIAGETDTTFRTATYDLVYNDFSSLALLTPAANSDDVPIGVEFTWTDLPHADVYDFEIATSPSFDENSILDIGTGLTEASFIPSMVLDEGELYFWRIRPSNVCGVKDFTFPSAFHTKAVLCDEFQATNIPLGISSTGTPTVTSELTIFESGTISDLNVIDMAGFHESLSDVVFSLISPAGTEVVLFGDICGNTAPFNLGLDDESPLEIDCPPINGQPYQPAEPLAAFDGENTSGIWKLQAKVIDDFGNGGLVDSWGLEFCASFSPTPPVLVKNDTLKVQPGNTQYVSNLLLLSEDADNTPEELTYTVVQAPEHGTLVWYNNEMNAGGQFRQISIDSWNVTYQHNGDDADFDSFYFVVEDGTGGFIGITKYDIKIDPTAPIATKEVTVPQGIEVFPNPTTGELNILLNKAANEEVLVQLLNVHGQSVKVQRFDAPGQAVNWNVAGLAGGIYLLNVQTKEGQFTQKVVITE